MAIFISAALFLIIASAITLFGYRRYVVAGQLYETLERADISQPFVQSPPNENFFSVTRAAVAVARKLPPSADKASAMRLKLLAAGYRETNAVAVLYGLKLILMAGVTLVVAAIELNSGGSPLMRVMGVGVAILAGFRLPDYFLSKRIKARQKKLRNGLPDSLDLIVVCAEAGLTIDRSFRTVSQQLATMHPQLCEEFSLFTAEISAGLRRKDALENLAARTQETEIRKFVAVLTQADRFGTSMGDALRTHADYLRSRRRQDAEEKASKVSVKLIFPIFFFIMPCMLLVTMGPAAIAIMKHLGQMFEPGQ